MQVGLKKQYPVAANAETAWRILTNIPELTSCMPGAQITEEIDSQHFKGSVKVKVGPAVAAFAGTIEILLLDPATHTLRMLGKGADKGGSSASMELTATLVPIDQNSSTLDGHAEVIVNGKFAQFGGRMMTSVSDMILGQFAQTFSDKAHALQAQSTPPAGETPPAPPDAPSSPAPAREINALELAWNLFRGWLAGLFGRGA